ncbi:MAG: ribonuclease D [Pseudomonadota bacterium]|nr:ribonuclease D [Pseudomonadota bacterium]
MLLITDSDTLSIFCKKVSASSNFITVDTEFMREATYWSELCLIQIAGEEDAAAIDVLSKNLDLSPVLDLMRNLSIVKVFHAARQDLEIFFRLMGEIPRPIFDTQIFSMVCGFGDSVGYETLVKSLTEERIDKTARFTNWKHRPLSKKQLSYALSDVTHLRIIYKRLLQMLFRNGRTDWVTQELEVLTNVQTYLMEPNESWKRLKHKLSKPRQLLILREVAAWRENEAQRRNIPRTHVLRDQALIEIASQAPRTERALRTLRGLKTGLPKAEKLTSLLAAINKGAELPEDLAPILPRRAQKDASMEATRDLIKILLKYSSNEHGVAPKLIINADGIEKLISRENSVEEMLSGWRYKVFGNHATKLLEGKLALSTDGKHIKLIDLGHPL